MVWAIVFAGLALISFITVLWILAKCPVPSIVWTSRAAMLGTLVGASVAIACFLALTTNIPDKNGILHSDNGKTYRCVEVKKVETYVEKEK